MQLMLLLLLLLDFWLWLPMLPCLLPDNLVALLQLHISKQLQ
jgi:hypothetical protein